MFFAKIMGLFNNINNFTYNKLLQVVSTQTSKRKVQNHSQQLIELLTFANAIELAVITVNQKFAIVAANKQAEKLFNFIKPCLYEQAIDSVITIAVRQLIIIKEAINKQEIKVLNNIKIVIADDEHYVKIVVYPGHNSQVNLCFFDITEQVFIENMLIQTEKMTSLGTLVAGMAHEINNPLSGIFQSMQNIRRRLEPDNPKNIAIAQEVGVSLAAVTKYFAKREIDQFFLAIKELSEHAATVVKNILKFSRRSDDAMLAMNINAIIQDTYSILTTDYVLKKQLQHKQLVIDLQLAKDMPKINCFPSEIEQVLLNLIKNAAYAVMEKTFTQHETPTIIIVTKKQETHVSIEITDNGAGIDAAIKPQLFKAFFTTKPRGIGTGLGLYIAHYIIVAKHYGKLLVTSKLGKGTTFTIELPLLTQQTVAEIK